MIGKPDPALQSEEHIRKHVQDFTLYKAEKDPHLFVMWDGKGFESDTQEGLVQQVLDYVALGDE